MLSWRHLTELGDAGVEIGGHSTSHPQLDQLPPAALQRELRDSKDLLEQRLGRPVHSLAYPFGYSSRRVRAAVAAAGYRSAAAVANGCAGPRPDLLALPRLTIARSTQLGTFARIVHGAELRRIYFAQHALTHGYAAVRWCRSLLHRVRPGA
jgi:peptidoglycan/xylan/chitin deacetylase (PgdA/CDA1 family)